MALKRVLRGTRATSGNDGSSRPRLRDPPRSRLALALVGLLGLFAFNARTPEWRAGWAEGTAAARLTPVAVVGRAVHALYMMMIVFAPIIIVLGVAPDLEAAIYFTAVVLILLGAAWALLELVFAQRRPASA